MKQMRPGGDEMGLILPSCVRKIERNVSKINASL
jgi:hypothetical protein